MKICGDHFEKSSFTYLEKKPWKTTVDVPTLLQFAMKGAVCNEKSALVVLGIRKIIF